MKTLTVVTTALFLTLPGALLAMPAVGDRLGTSAEEVRTALEAAGCPVRSFEAEDGKIEAKCSETATGAKWEIYIDPKTGIVAKMTKGS